MSRRAEQLLKTADRRADPRSDPHRRAHHDLIFTFARASEQHDGDAEGHLTRIRLLVQALAGALGFDADDAEEMSYDAMLHDVGKLSVPAAVLNKTSPLTESERDLIRSHTIRGERMLRSRDSTRRAAAIARHHHESWDGTGYPDGVAGEAIPIEARITAVADVLDALMTRRSYKSAWSYDDARREMAALAGTKLDPSIVRALDVCDRSGAVRRIFDPAAEP